VRRPAAVVEGVAVKLPIDGGGASVTVALACTEPAPLLASSV